MTIFVVLSSWPKSLREFTRFIWWMQTERRVAANPQTKPVDFGLWVRRKLAAVIHIHHRHCYYYSARRLIVILPSHKGGRLSRPKHCSKGAQPVLKTVYRSSFRDKHNCQWRDSNLDALTPQSDALTTRLLTPAKLHKSHSRAGKVDVCKKETSC